MNTPTTITMLRIGAVPIIVICYYLPFSWAHGLAAVIFTLAALTDWLDGYLARSLKQMTKLGAFLDPVADKLLVAITLIIIVSNHHISYVSIPAAIIVGREIAISALREWLAEIGKRASVKVNMIAKLKTTLQMVSLVLLLWYRPESPGWILGLGAVLLYFSAVLTLWSMYVYTKLAWPDLTLSREQ